VKIGVISTYPQKNQNHHRSGGVSYYTKNLVDGISSIKKEEDEIVLLTEKTSDSGMEYFENQIIVNRCWNADIRYILQIIRKAKNYRTDIVHLQFEYFLYGGIISSALFPLLLLFYKITNVSTIVTLHQVIRLSKFNSKFRKDNSIRGIRLIQKLGLFVLTKLIARLSNKIIVHDNFFKDTLTKEYGCRSAKISVIPIGVEEKNDVINKTKGKEILNLSDRKIILYFGYISRYKGIEKLIDAFGSLNSNLTLVIAGGEHPRLKDNKEYKEYIINLKKRAKYASQNIIFTGFVNEDMIPVYFSAADVIILPYTLQSSSSGPLALASAYERPFLVSEEFINIQNPDIKFKNNATDIANIIMKFFNNPQMQRNAITFSRNLKFERDLKKVAEKHVDLYKEVIR
jgi:glycosyltransferase involved in cell wall biosynthesis